MARRGRHLFSVWPFPIWFSIAIAAFLTLVLFDTSAPHFFKLLKYSFIYPVIITLPFLSRTKVFAEGILLAPWQFRRERWIPWSGIKKVKLVPMEYGFRAWDQLEFEAAGSSVTMEVSTKEGALIEIISRKVPRRELSLFIRQRADRHEGSWESEVTRRNRFVYGQTMLWSYPLFPVISFLLFILFKDSNLGMAPLTAAAVVLFIGVRFLVEHLALKWYLASERRIVQKGLSKLKRGKKK